MESSVQKTRKVLEYLLHKFYYGADGYPHARLNLRDNGMIKASLSIPLRNCDVGTPEEQTERFKQLCRKYRRGPGPRANCKGCPISLESQNVGCTFAWSQMPYVEGDNDGR